MKRIVMVLGAVFFSVSAANAAGFSTQGQAVLHHEKVEKCFSKAWKNSKPTDEQEAAAKPLCDAAKAVADEHKDAISQAMADLHAVWSAHPLNKGDIVNAEENLKGHVTPVREAFRDAAIDIINLLTEEQHKNFTKSFKKCMDEGKGKGDIFE